MKFRTTAAVFSFFLATSAFAQIATTTALVGTVTDPASAVVKGASVTAVQNGTGDTYSATTNEQGYYNIQFIRIGDYTITVKQAGFQSAAVKNIHVDLNQIVRNDVVLKIGDVTQTINVEGTAAAIKTDDASVSETISVRHVSELPLNGRDPLKLAAITSGTLTGLKASNGVPPGQDFIGAGTREITNSVSLDGVSIVNNLITTTPTRPSVDAVQEVQVQTGTYGAQYGSYMGVHIDVVTKSGTNDLHGSLVEFVRNDKFDARPFFLSPTAKKTPLRQNQFGIEVDGPVYIPKLYNGKNKTFFMGSYEGLRQIRQGSGLASVMTAPMFSGDFSQTATVVKDPFAAGAPFAGNKVPASRLTPIAAKLQPYYTTPNLGGITNNLGYSAANNNNTDQSVDRVDQNIGSSARIYFRFQVQKGDIFAGASVPSSASTSPLVTRNYGAGYTQTISPNLVNDLRFGKQWFESNTLNDFYVKGLTHAGKDLGIANFDGDVAFNNPGIPEFNVTGFTGWGNSGSNWFQNDATWMVSDQMSWNHGPHTIVAGLELRKLQTSRAAQNSPRGAFSFNGQYSGYAPADFMMGLIQSSTSPSLEVQGIVAEWRDGFFVNDKWQVNRKLTLNLGLRYELPTVPYSVNGNGSILNPGLTAFIPGNAPQKGFQFINANHKDWAPRVGFAYRLLGNTVIRGGFGMYYNANQTNSFTLASTNPPFATQVSFTSSPTTPQLSYANPLGTASVTGPINAFTLNPNLPTPRMNQWSLGIDRELWKGAGLEVSYLGSHQYHLDRSYYINTPQPGPGSVNPRRPNQSFLAIRMIQDDEIANYEALSFVIRQRVSHGVSFLANYTYGHTLDVSSDSNNGGAPMNPFNWRADYGNANWDIRSRFVGSVVYDIPGLKTANPVLKAVFSNWQMNMIYTQQTGLPFNVSSPTDSANTSSGGTARPDLVATPSSNCGGGHLVACINSAAFALVPTGVYRYGNAGRNLLHGPGLFNVDYSFFRNIPIHERLKLQFRAEMFNILNHPNFGNPATTFTTASFGNITGTTTDNRDIQFGLRLSF